MYNKMGINKNTYDLLTEDFFFENAEDYGTLENFYVIRMLEIYTAEVNKSIITKLKNKRINYKNFKKDKKNGIHTFNSSISFKLLSEDINNIPKEEKRKLESDDRLKKCHSASLSIALSLKDVKVLTGIIKYAKDHTLHSVVEVIDKTTNKEMIIDYTRNLIIDKETYINLFEFNVLSEVSSEELASDIETLKKYDMYDFSLKLYFTFRNEFISGLEKNKCLIKE